MTNDIALTEILSYIENANDDQINQLLDAVSRRYRRLFPEWDIIFLSLPMEPAERNHQLEWMLHQLSDGTVL